MISVELAILNYNGRRHLEHLLPTAVEEAQRYGAGCRIVVVDNRSTEPDAEWVRADYPAVEVWVAPANDYLFSYNPYAEQSRADVLVLLNNDLKLQPGFVAPLVRPFEQSDVFAVSATSRDWEDRQFTFGPIRLGCHRGSYYWMPDYLRQEPGPTLFTSGGFMAVDRRKFLAVGGFDRLYYPAYCEDLDLCFRAWRRGWRCLFEPRSVALHREHGSWNGTSGTRAQRLLLRSKLLFEWSSLPPADGRMPGSIYRCAVALGELRPGSCWRLATHWRACRDWRRLRKQRAHPPANRVELEAIQARLQTAV